MLVCSHGAGRIAAQFLGHRSPVGLHDKFAQHAGALVLAGQDVEQRSPQVGIATEPVQGITVEQLTVE